jgi:hypothetical protein
MAFSGTHTIRNGKPIYEYTGNVLLQRDKTIPSLQNAFFFLSFMKTRGYHGLPTDSLLVHIFTFI